MESICIADYYLDIRHKYAIIPELKVVAAKKGAMLIAAAKVEL